MQYDENWACSPDCPPAIESAESALPAEAGMLLTTRAGDSDRELYITHLGDMHADGHINAAQYEARRNRAMLAETHIQLAETIADLPRIPPGTANRRPVRKGYDFANPAHSIPALAITAILSLLLAIVPSAIAGADLWFHTLAGTVVCVPTLILGIVGFVISAIWGIVKAIEAAESK